MELKNLFPPVPDILSKISQQVRRSKDHVKTLFVNVEKAKINLFVMNRMQNVFLIRIAHGFEKSKKP